MFCISDVSSSSPKTFGNPLQQKVYEVLKKLEIPFSRVTTDEAITMEDCILINEKLGMEMVKTLFLCNRQQTMFYLFITAGDKAFSAKNFSHALGVSRVSFAPQEAMTQILGTVRGAATFFSALCDDNNQFKVVIDKDVADSEWYGCSDGTTTGYMKIKTGDMLKVLDFAAHSPSSRRCKK